MREISLDLVYGLFSRDPQESAIPSFETIEGATQILVKEFCGCGCFRGYTHMRGNYVNQDQVNLGFVDLMQNNLHFSWFLGPLLSGFDPDVAYTVVDFDLFQDLYVLFYCKTLSIERVFPTRPKTEYVVFGLL